MVYKTGKYGTRSGATFRANDKRFQRRYRRDAYMFRSCQGGDGSEVVGILGEGKETSDNVHYSLNKQRRWELPGVIDSLIHSGEHDDDVNYQLVQRHNILRKANCVSVVSSTGVLKRGEITKDSLSKTKNSGGFFQSNSVLDTKAVNPLSRRERREQRRRQQHQAEVEEVENQPTEVPQIRYEIIQPTPVTSYLAHNPKSVGIDTRKPFVWEGYQDRHKKSRKRTRFTNDIREMLDHAYEESSEDESDIIAQVNAYEEANKPETSPLTSFSLSELLTRATRAGDLLCDKKIRNYRTSSSSSGSESEEQKSHIFYLDNDSDVSPNPSNSNTKSVKSTQRPKRHRLEMEPIRVILQNESTTPKHLAECYGEDYFEAECFPRKFIINISKKVLPTNHKTVCVYLVFNLDTGNEMNTMIDSVFNVFVNAHFKDHVHGAKLETVFDYTEIDIDELINRAVFYFETLPDDALNIEFRSVVASKKTQSQVEMCANWSTKSYYPINTTLIEHLKAQKEESVDNSTTKKIEVEAIGDDSGYEVVENDGANDVPHQETDDVTSPQGQFCGICYEELGPTNGSALLSCSHWFCDVCWREHIYTQIDSGSLSLQCPEYGCKHQVDCGTLLSLVGVSDVLRFARLYHDNKVQVQAVRRWCPNEKCGRAVEVSTDNVNFAKCVCGKKFCMECMDNAHWPAPCDVTKSYLSKLRKTGDIALFPEGTITTVSIYGKNCPLCKRFIEKNGGCPYMYCVCGGSFCWGCGLSWGTRSHDTTCYTKGTKDRHGTQKFKIEPDRIEDKKREAWYKMAVTHRLNQHPDRLAQMKQHMRNTDITLKVRHYITKSHQKGQPVFLDFEMNNDKYRNEVDKVYDWLKNSLDLYVEVSHLVENAAVLVGLTSLPSLLKRRVLYIIKRLSFFAENIYLLLKRSISTADFVSELKDTRFHSKESIQSLIKVCKQNAKL